jgi:replicative DNA helicase
MTARVDSGRMRRGFMARSEFGRVQYAVNYFQDRGLYITDQSYLSALEIKAKARKLATKKKRLDLIVIDHLGFMKHDPKILNLHHGISKSMKILKSLAKDLDVPIILLCQLSRKVEDRKPPIPMLSDLKESGSIEEDSDIVLFMYREGYYKRDDPAVQGIGEVIVAKNRNGPTGKVKLTWLAEYSRFENLAKGE